MIHNINNGSPQELIFFNEAICNKATNRKFNLREFANKFYYTERKEMAMQLELSNKDGLWVIEAI